MRIFGGKRATYLYISGLKVSRSVVLASGIELIPAELSCSETLLRAVTSGSIDFHIASLVAPTVGSQLKVSGSGSKDVAMRAWNATWDILLIGALFDLDIFAILHSTTNATRVTSKTKLHITHYYVPRFVFQPGAELDADCVSFLEAKFGIAQKLMARDKRFSNAVHCLATYRWHTLPRAQLALVWSGIEGLFAVESELSFRVSLYAARFLADTQLQQKEIFSLVKRLYAQRSKAVHGAELKSEPKKLVSESTQLLRSVILQCIHNNSLPVIDELAP